MSIDMKRARLRKVLYLLQRPGTQGEGVAATNAAVQMLARPEMVTWMISVLDGTPQHTGSGSAWLKEEVKRFRQEAEQLRRQLAMADEALRAATAQKERAEQRSHRSEHTARQLAFENRALALQARELQKQSAALTEKLQVVEEDRARLTKQNQSLRQVYRTNLTIAEAQLRKLQEQSAALTEELQAAQEDRARLTTQNQSIRQAYLTDQARAKAQLRDLRGRLKAREQEDAAVRASVSALKQQQAIASATIATQWEQLAALKQQRAADALLIEAQETIAAEEMVKCAALEERCGTLRAAARRAEQRSREQDEEINTLAAEIRDLKAAAMWSARNEEIAQNKLQQASKETQAHQRQLDEAMGTIRTLKASLSRKVSPLQQEAARRGRAVQALEAEVRSLTAENQELHQHRHRLQRRVDELAARIRALERPALPRPGEHTDAAGWWADFVERADPAIFSAAVFSTLPGAPSQEALARLAKTLALGDTWEVYTLQIRPLWRALRSDLSPKEVARTLQVCGLQPRWCAIVPPGAHRPLYPGRDFSLKAPR